MTPPQKPDQISPIRFNNFEVLTQTNLPSVLEAIEKGERTPLNHVMIPYTDYLNMAAWISSIKKYIVSSEAYFKSVDAQYKKLNSPKEQ